MTDTAVELHWKQNSDQLACEAQAVLGRKAKLLSETGVRTRRAETVKRQRPCRRRRDGEFHKPLRNPRLRKHTMRHRRRNYGFAIGRVLTRVSWSMTFDVAVIYAFESL